MKKIMTLLFAAGLVCASALPASAIEFKAEGEWLKGFGLGDKNFVSKVKEDGAKSKYSNEDKFSAMQRVRLQLEAVASDDLSATILFECLDTAWGGAENGGALGADGVNVGILNAFIDWAIPETDIKVRMGLQPIELPAVAGGTSVLATDAMAAVAVSADLADNISATFFWGRPYNDNYTKIGDDSSNDQANYLDNIDLFALALEMDFDGIEVSPWVMYGVIGQNAARMMDDDEYAGNTELFAFPDVSAADRTKANSSAFWAGLPIAITMFDPLNIELDLSYGYVESVGRFDLDSASGDTVRADSKREGWLVKALVEYKMDFGTPGIFAWYASGDDDNPKNGSERIPSIEAKGCFTSFLGDDNFGWGSNDWYDMSLNYGGTWGIGVQVAEISLIDDLTSTIRVAYWRGTNDPAMAKYAESPIDWHEGTYSDGLYLTKNDYLIEFNLINSWEVYENLEINFELGYIINGFDQNTWERSIGGLNGDAYQKQDAWKAQIIFAYSF